MTLAGTSTSDRECAPCIGGYSDAENELTCMAWRDCVAGEYMTSPGTATADRECERCAPGSTSSEPNQTECRPCRAGTEPHGDLGCAACMPGTFCPGGVAAVPCETANEEWDHDGDPATACAPWTVCGAWGTLREGDALTDRECFAAPLWEWSDGVLYTAWLRVSSMRFLGDDVVVANNMYRTDNCGAHCRWKGRLARVGSSGTRWHLTALGLGLHQYSLGQIDMDEAGNAYVPVQTYDEVNVFGLTIQVSGGVVFSVDGAGAQRTTRAYANHLLRALTLTGDGEVTVAGSRLAPTGAMVHALDAAGNLTQQTLLGGHYRDVVASISRTSTGDLIVAGTVFGALPGMVGAGAVDAFLMGLSENLEPRWTVQFGSVGDDHVGRVVAMPDGTCVFAGSARGALPGQVSAGGWDPFVGWYDPATGTLSLEQFGGPYDDVGGDVAVDENGTAYVVGGGVYAVGAASPGVPAFLRAYAQDRSLLWQRNVYSGGDPVEGTAVIVDATRIAVGGSRQVTQFSATRRDAFVRVFPRQ